DNPLLDFWRAGAVKPLILPRIRGFTAPARLFALVPRGPSHESPSLPLPGARVGPPDRHGDRPDATATRVRTGPAAVRALQWPSRHARHLLSGASNRIRLRGPRRGRPSTWLHLPRQAIRLRGFPERQSLSFAGGARQPGTVAG